MSFDAGKSLEHVKILSGLLFFFWRFWQGNKMMLCLVIPPCVLKNRNTSLMQEKHNIKGVLERVRQVCAVQYSLEVIRALRYPPHPHSRVWF